MGDDDRELPWGETGEIVGVGPLLMSGYHGNDAASGEATWVDPTGRRRLRSGDLGRFDADGYLYIVDRKKDMILSAALWSLNDRGMRAHPQFRPALHGVRRGGRGRGWRRRAGLFAHLRLLSGQGTRAR